MARPFDPSLMVYFRKRLTPDILGEINELIIQKAKEKPQENHHDDDDKPQPPQNSETMIVDATCAPSNIKYQQDTELLNEARENTEAMIDGLHNPKEGKRPRTLYEQQKMMYDNKNHFVKDRIVSLSQPYLRPIVRGKAKAPVEFGAKLDISVVDGFVRLEKQSFDSYNESTCLWEEIERYKVREGCYPERVLADKIYRNRKNLNYCKEREIRLSGPALVRPKKDITVDKKLEYADICDRVEMEQKFSLAKRKCGLGLHYLEMCDL